MTPGEVTELEEVRRAMNARWDGYQETLISRNKLALKQTTVLLQALLAKVLGGGVHEYIVSAPTENFIGTWKLNGYEVLNKLCRIVRSTRGTGRHPEVGCHEAAHPDVHAEGRVAQATEADRGRERREHAAPHPSEAGLRCAERTTWRRGHRQRGLTRNSQNKVPLFREG